MKFILIILILSETIFAVYLNTQEMVLSKMFDCLTLKILEYDPETGVRLNENKLFKLFGNYGCHCFTKTSWPSNMIVDEADKCCLMRQRCLRKFYQEQPHCHYLLDNNIIKIEGWSCADMTINPMEPLYSVLCNTAENHKCASERCQCNKLAATCLTNFLRNQNKQGILFTQKVCQLSS